MNELSDKDQPKKLEDLFRNGMDEAEMAPSDNLWNRIEHDLDIQEKGYYKKQLFWFQRVAAACALLLLVSAGYFLYDYKFKHEGIIATANKKETTPTEIASIPPPEADEAKNNKPKSGTPEFRSKDKPVIGSKIFIASNSKKSAVANKIAEKTNQQLANTKPQLSTRQSTYLATAENVSNKESENIISGAEAATIAQPELALNENSGNILNTETGNTQPLADISRDDLLNMAQTNLETNLVAIDSALLALPTASTPKPILVAYATAIEKPEKQKTSRWSFAGKYAPQYFNQNIKLNEPVARTNNPSFSNNLVSLNNSPSSYAEALNEFDNNTQAGYSFNTEGAASYELNKHWALETGLAYTQNISNTNTSYIFNNSQVTPRYASESFSNDYNSDAGDNRSNLIGVPATALVASLSGTTNNAGGVVQTQPFTAKYRYRLIGIPVKINYQTNRSKSFYYASVGFLTNLLMQAHIISDSPRVPDLKYAPNADSPFRNVQMAAIASVGKGFRVSKNFSLKAGLEASQYFTTLVDNPLYSTGLHGKPYAIGIAVSSSYNISK